MILRLLRNVVPVVFCLAMASLASGQSAQISGTVKDPTGAVVPKASISAKSTTTNAQYSTETIGSGYYVLSNLRPGSYDVTVSKDSFRTVQFSAVLLTVDQALTLDATLEVSATSQSITVQGETVAQVDTTDSQVSAVVDERQMRALPLILRDPYQLILLTPGTVATNSGIGGFAVSGSRERNNNFQLDGADNNDPGVPGAGVAALNPDITQEFRVISNNFSSEFGRDSGAVIDIVTKSGTNSLNGDIYWFGRYDALGARDFFNPGTGPNGRRKDPYVRNDFGASLGGPIFKDKTFFFGNYEGQRFATTVTPAPAPVPTAAFKTGIFTFNGTNYNVSTPNSPSNIHHLSLDPLVQKVMALFPSPTPGVPGPNDITGLLFFASPDHFTADNYTLKIDHAFSSRHQLSARYVASKVNDDNVQHLENLPGIGGLTFDGLTQSIGGHLSSTFSSRVVNDLQASALRSHGPFNCTGLSILDGLSKPDEFGRSRDWSFGSFAPIACSALGDSNGQLRAFGNYAIGDKLTWILGRHTVKLGIDVDFSYENNFNDFGSRPLPNFAVFTNDAVRAVNGSNDNNFQDSVWSLFGSVHQDVEAQFFTTAGNRTGKDQRGIREHDLYLFMQDSFKLASNFTLNYGLRYELNGTPYDIHDQLSTLSPAAISGPPPLTFLISGRHGNIPLYPTNLLGFEPRLGFAWDPFKTGKTSVRGGYGIFRDRSFFNFIGNTRSNPPFTQNYTNNAFAALGAVAADQISNIPSPVTVATPSATVPNGAAIFTGTVDTNLRLPLSQDWNFGVQRELPGNFMMEVTYVGAKTDHLSRVVDGNAPDPAKIAALRTFCHQNPTICTDTPTVSDVQGFNLYFGQEFGFFPFDAVNNNAFFHENLTKSIASSIYHALQVSATHRFSRGIFFQVNYTYSHSIDDSGDTLAPQSGNVVFPVDSFDLKLERGNSGTDVRHNLVFNYTADLPLGRGKAHFSDGFVGRVLEGWSLSGVTQISSGTPYEIFTFKDSAGTGATQRPDFNPQATPTTIAAGKLRTQTGPNVAFFSEPAFGKHGNLGRNVFAGPGNNNWDMVLAKNTKISERFQLEFRTEAFNLFNRVHFSRANRFIENTGTFGQSTSTVGRSDGTTSSRQLQLALKLHF